MENNLNNLDNEDTFRKEINDLNNYDSAYNKSLSNNIFNNISKTNDLRKPHEKTIEETVYEIRVVLSDVLSLVLDGKNPMSYIFSSDNKQFAFCLLLLIIGITMLLISNILK
jgi:hypothetical protein